FKFAMFFLAEYINMVTVSALATTMFLGGWRAPFGLAQIWEGANEGYWPVLWFFLKTLGFIFVFIWLRGTLPRMRYDQFMHFGWKWLIPIALGWIVALAFIRKLQVEDMLDQQAMLIAAGVAGALLIVTFFLPTRDEDDEPEVVEPQEFDAFAGGFPVPPLPAQREAMATAPTTTSQPTDGGEQP